MEKVDEFFGIPIFEDENGKYYAMFKGERVDGDYPDDVKNNIMAFERKEKRKNVIERLQNVGDGMSENAAEFVVNMIVAYHSCETGALLRIGDYLSSHGL